MKIMPSRDTAGKCKGECRDRVFEGEKARQNIIDQETVKYSGPSSKSPSWTSKRKDPPGAMGGRV
jgi:hypothetical protein